MRSEADVFRRLREADWGIIGKKLLIHAHYRAAIYYSWRGDQTFELAAGHTIEDIIQEAILKACTGERKWNPEKGSLELWLKDQINSLMDHLAKSATNRYETHTLETIRGDSTEDPWDSDALEYAPPESARVASAEEIAIRQEEVKQEFDLLLGAADGDEQLEQMIQVVWEGYEKSSEISEAMGVPVKEVYTLTRKLKRRVARKREQYGTPQ